MKDGAGHHVALGILVFCAASLLIWTLRSSFVPLTAEGRSRQRAHTGRLEAEQRKDAQAAEAHRKWKESHPTCYVCGKPATTRINYVHPAHQKEPPASIPFCDEHAADPPKSVTSGGSYAEQAASGGLLRGIGKTLLWGLYFFWSLFRLASVVITPFLLFMCFVDHEPKLSFALEAWLVLFVGLAAVHSIRYLEIYSDHWFSLVTLPGVLYVVKQKADEG